MVGGISYNSDDIEADGFDAMKDTWDVYKNPKETSMDYVGKRGLNAVVSKLGSKLADVGMRFFAPVGERVVDRSIGAAENRLNLAIDGWGGVSPQVVANAVAQGTSGTSVTEPAKKRRKDNRGAQPVFVY